MPRILLVDDDIAEISAVKRVLTRAGHQPVLATNASDALASITQERPALLVVSATCESGDALNLARGLPDEADTAGIPLLVLGDATDLPKGARFLPRPLDPEQLAAEVKGALAAAPATPAAPPPPGRAAPVASIGRMQPVRAVPPAALEEASLPHPAPPDPAPSIAPAPSSAPPPAPAALAEPRRTGPANAAAARRAAADALRARAEELRRRALGGGAPPPPAAARPPQPTLAPPPPAAPPPKPSPEPDGPAAAKAPPPPPAPPPAAEEERAARRAAAEEARQQAADEALRALEVEASAHVAEVRARAAPANRPDPAAAALAAEAMEASRRSEEERRLRETIEAARKEAFEAARRELEERAKEEAAQAALRQAAAEDRARVESEARKEAVAAAQKESGELARQKDEAARRQVDAETRAEAEAEGRRRVEDELASLRAQLADERLKAEERMATVMKRAAAEEEAAEELRRMAEDETRQREEETERVRGEEEQKLRTAFASAKAELETLRKRTEEEGQRRAEAEAALKRAETAQREEIARREEQTRREEERRRQEQTLREEQARREEQRRRQDPALRESPPPHAPPAPALDPAFTTPDFFAPFDGAEGEPTPEPLADPAEDAARRRVAVLRGHEPSPEPPPAPPPSREPAPPLAADPTALDEPEEPARPISMPSPQLRAGDLADLSAPRLLALAARAKLEGRLDFQGEVARSIWFEDGRVVGATSAEPSERVEEVALRLGLITRDQHRRMAQAAATLPSRRAALLLLERGFLKASELTGLVRRRTEEVVFGIFAEEDGRFRWLGARVPPEERTTLERPPLALAVEGVRRRWLSPRVDALLGGPATLLMPVQGGPAATDLWLSPEERRLASLADGLRTLDELVEASPLDDLSSRQVLSALVLVGALTVRLVQGGRPAAQAAAAIDLARVKDKLEQVRRADYFTVLGVGRHGTPHEVREAADRLQGEFDPRRFAGIAEEGLPARLAEILQVVQDAREVLADDRLREEYLRGLGDTG